MEHVEMDSMDSYVASIELSNKCRDFYRKRMEHAETARQRLSPTFDCQKKTKKSSLDLAMEKLGEEMTSLMDQDLSLMKQLLMLNEAIEELKFNRRYSNSSMPSSSCDLSGSDLSVSDTDMFDSQEQLDINCNTHKHSNANKTEGSDRKCTNTKLKLHKTTESKLRNIKNKLACDNSTTIIDEQNTSYDSGCEFSFTST